MNKQNVVCPPHQISATKRSEVLMHATPCVNLENIKQKKPHTKKPHVTRLHLCDMSKGRKPTQV
jgi:hypothetical protein